jgi:hypothetical protein
MVLATVSTFLRVQSYGKEMKRGVKKTGLVSNKRLSGVKKTRFFDNFGCFLIYFSQLFRNFAA